jgi:hypothetical protein
MIMSESATKWASLQHLEFLEIRRGRTDKSPRKIIVYDQVGNEVFKETDQNKNSLDLSYLQNGMYTIKIIQGTEERSAKIIIVK